MSKEKLFDVVAVNHDTQQVRFLDTGKTERNAEAIEKMAIARRGLDEEFYAVVPAGTYKEGDTWARKRVIADLFLASKRAQDFLNEVLGNGMINTGWDNLFTEAQETLKDLDEALEEQAQLEAAGEI